jgi:MFS transporter, ACS family, solute carrier family 17 (sodium-dependent inorganic phosphate cotransporter), other
MFLKLKDFLYRTPKVVLKKIRAFSLKIPTRLKIGAMMFTGSCVSYMLRSNFSIILLAMSKNSQDGYEWSNHDQNLLLSAYFWGYTLPNLIGGYLCEKYGGKIVIFLVFFLSSIITALSPMTANDDFRYLFMARLLLGFLGVKIYFMKSFFENKILKKI